MPFQRIIPLFLLIIYSFSAAFAQGKITRVEPPNWWIGMKNPRVELLVYGEKIGDWNPTINYAGVQIEKVIKVPNANYLFIDLLISADAKQGKVSIQFMQGGKMMATHQWELWQRDKGAADRKGFSASDVLYLITPDRFANGDPGNDAVAGMREKPNRALKGGRHGGDIEGIRQHLGYIGDMGFTAIWINPVLENDMPEYSYHGYATTDFYKVDPRFGSNESYRQLCHEANAQGIKVIMDMIVNHCGLEHWWMKDKPTPDWINTWDTYTQTNHRKAVLQDPYGSQLDKKIFTDGWFVPTMPDMNQRNPLMATYLTQNTIWWVEYLGLGGIRMDTYPYPDMDYMAEWTRDVMAEYPNFSIVGEEWYGNPIIVSYWQRGKHNANGYTSDLTSLMDFPMQSNLTKALMVPESWGEGLFNLYEILTEDFLYPHPNDLVIFPDNHDMSRFFTQVNEDFDLFKLGLTYILTTRGVPQLYYGTEILMKNPGTDDHGIIRSDFQGGWTGDAVNGFTGEGLTPQQKEAQSFIRNLLNWRKTADVIHHGKLLHFIPDGGVYVYFRYNDSKKVMVIMNKNAQPTTLYLQRFAEVLSGVTKGTDVLTHKTFELKDTIIVPGKTPLVLELE